MPRIPADFLGAKRHRGAERPPALRFCLRNRNYLPRSAAGSLMAVNAHTENTENTEDTERISLCKRFLECGALAPLWKAATRRRTPKKTQPTEAFCHHVGNYAEFVESAVSLC